MNPAILLGAVGLVTMLLTMGGKKQEGVVIVPPAPPSPGDPAPQFISSALNLVIR